MSYTASASVSLFRCVAKEIGATRLKSWRKQQAKEKLHADHAELVKEKESRVASGKGESERADDALPQIAASLPTRKHPSPQRAYSARKKITLRDTYLVCAVIHTTHIRSES